ncbi:hypothetical protein TeGR_g2856, partial [Tetraparma gracilis]
STFAAPPYLDAGALSPSTTPAGGSYRGYFQNAPKKAGRVAERFLLYFDASSGAGVRVRGAGQNKFGAFTLGGSLDPATGRLSVTRTYVPYKFLGAPAAVLSLSHSPHRAKPRPPDEVPPVIGAGDKIVTRKKRMTWQRDDGADPWADPAAAPRGRRADGGGGEGPRPAKRAPQQGGVASAALARGGEQAHYALNPYSDPAFTGAYPSFSAMSAANPSLRPHFPFPRPNPATRLPPPREIEEGMYRSKKAHFRGPGGGEVYEGGLLNGKRHGLGTMLYRNGNAYRGGWKADKEHGRGTLYGADMAVLFEGEFFAGKIMGAGTMSYADGSKYQGDFNNNTRSGFGRLTFASGAVYAGEFKEGMFWGRGRLTWAESGNYYDGEWLNGQRHGKGLLELSGKDGEAFSYNGSWIRDVMEGRGTAKYADGSVFDGQFIRGRREGRGTVEWANGACYEGRFRHDQIEGVGTCSITKCVVDGREGDKSVENLSFIIPICVSDLENIHQKAGFTSAGC